MPKKTINMDALSQGVNQAQVGAKNLRSRPVKIVKSMRFDAPLLERIENYLEQNPHLDFTSFATMCINKELDLNRRRKLSK